MKPHCFIIAFAAFALGLLVVLQAVLCEGAEYRRYEEKENRALKLSVDAAVAFLGTEYEEKDVTEIEYACEELIRTYSVLTQKPQGSYALKKTQGQFPLMVITQEDGFRLRYYVENSEGSSPVITDIIPYGPGEKSEALNGQIERLLSDDFFYKEKGSEYISVLTEYSDTLGQRAATDNALLVFYAGDPTKKPGKHTIYASSNAQIKQRERYYVDENGKYHKRGCEKIGRIVCTTGSTKECAERGAFPCENCFR